MRIIYKLILTISIVVLFCTLPISFLAIQRSQLIITEKTFEVCTIIASNIVTIARDELFLDSAYQNTANLVAKLKKSEVKALDNVYIMNVYGKYVVDMNQVNLGKYASKENIEYFRKIEKVTQDEINLSDKNILRFSYPVYLDEKKKIRIGMAVFDFNKDILYQPVKDIRYFIILIGSVVFILALIVSIAISIFITKPIQALSKGVLEFGKGNFQYRIRLKTSDEYENLANSFNSMADSLDSADKLKNEYIKSYQKFVPMEIITFLQKESILDVLLGDQVQKEMTILFSDIRSFTTISETLTPEENFNFINSYLKRMGPIVRKHRGYIDKYIGDAIMALFPYSPDDAINSAIEMQFAIKEYNEHRTQQGFVGISIGIGLHTGKLMLGTIGENERMEATVISDSVNLASRLESLTKTYKSPIIISEKTFIRMDNLENYNYRMLGNVLVKGKKEEVSIIEILNHLPKEKLDLIYQTKDEFEKGILLYQIKEYKKALNSFQNVIKINKEDLTSKYYIERCEYVLKYGVEWQEF